MRNIEREEVQFLQIETGDEEGTYEKKTTDLGNTIVYSGNSKKTKAIQKKLLKKKSENIIFTD